MRSVSAKIIFWAVAALLISLAVFIMFSRTVIGGARHGEPRPL